MPHDQTVSTFSDLSSESDCSDSDNSDCVLLYSWKGKETVVSPSSSMVRGEGIRLTGSESDVDVFSDDVQRYESTYRDQAKVDSFRNKTSISATKREEDIVLAPCPPGEKTAKQEMVEPATSPQKKKTKLGRKGEGKNSVVELDAAFDQSLWHRDFNYRRYMEDHVPFSAVGTDAAFHGKFGELVQNAGSSVLRSLMYIHSMERKYEALEEEFQDSVKEVEKFNHKATDFEERVQGLLKDKATAEKVASDLEKEKIEWLKSKRDLESKVEELEGELDKAKDEVESGKMALVGYFEDGFQRAKSQVLFFHPGLDVAGLDSLKIVHDGELIDEP